MYMYIIHIYPPIITVSRRRQGCTKQ